jgi:hypothetical protein
MVQMNRIRTLGLEPDPGLGLRQTLGKMCFLANFLKVLCTVLWSLTVVARHRIILSELEPEAEIKFGAFHDLDPKHFV